MSYINLLSETSDKLLKCNKHWKDVEYILCGDFMFTAEEAMPMMDFNYDNGYGGQEVDPSLKVVGSDWWLERHEYDGSEWWEYKEKPTKGKVGGYQFSTFRNHWDEPEEYDDYIGAKQ